MSNHMPEKWGKMVCISVHKKPIAYWTSTGFAKKITLKSNLKSYFSKDITVSTLCIYLPTMKKSQKCSQRFAIFQFLVLTICLGIEITE